MIIIPVISGSTVIRGSKGTPVAQDVDDKLITVIQGSQGNAVAQDVNDRLIAMMYGAAGTPVAQDAANKLISIIQGSQGAAIAQDATNKLIAVMQGSQGVAVAQDATNRLITAIVGSTGNPVSQDASDNLVAMMHGSEGTPIAQDTNNYLITVIKGMYSGSLETIALDQDHAIKAVLYDPIDDWNKTQTIGLNELGTRLGGLQRFDNRGRLIWNDDFEGTVLKWNTSIVGTATLALSNAIAHNGDGSIKLNIPTTSNSSAKMQKTFYHSLSGVYGVEIAWSSNSVSWNTFKFGFEIYDGVYKWNYYIDLLGAARSFFMREQGFGNRGIGSMTYEIADNNFWHKWKVVVNTATERIIRVMADGIEYDPSAYEVEHVLDAASPHINTFISAQNNGALVSIHLDDFILTQMEPV